MSEQRPSPRVRISILGGIAVVVLVGAAFVMLREPRHAGTAPAVVRKDGGAAIRAPRGPNVPAVPGEGVALTGFVVDGANLPVAGAEVSAEREEGREGPRASGLGPRAEHDGGAGDAGVMVVATPTGADGHFVIEGLAPGRYRVHVAGAGLLAAEVRFVPVPSDEARIVVARQVTIEGTVTDGGRVVAAAMVGIRGDAIGGALEVKTDGKGAFKVPNLPEGRYQVYAWQGAAAARAVRVNRLGAGPFPPLELRLEAAAIVVGKILDRGEGTGLVAAVELRPSGDDQAPRYARSGSDGVFRIEGVPNGRWIADAFAPGYLSAGGVELEAGRGVPELALVRGAAIEGRVLDGDGRPIAGATVRALTGGPNASELSEAVDRDRLRRYSGRTATPVPESATPSDDPQFLARGELGVMLGPIPPLPPPGAQIARPAAVIDPAATTASSLAGEPAPLDVDPARASIWTTGPDGRYRVRGLAKGKVTVLAVAPGFAEARSRQVSLGAGELVDGVDIVVTPGTYLVGKVTDQHGAPVIGAEVSARPEVGAAVEGFADGDGAYRLGPLTGGVELRAAAYGHVELRKKLELAPVRGATAGEQREDLVLEVADAVLAGTLDDAAGAPVPGARLEIVSGSAEGRRAVVGADGTFSIDLLPRGPLRVRVEHPDYPPDELDAEASTTGERVRLHLALGGAVEGALLDAASGAPLASVTVLAAGPGAATAEASTDKTGHWKLGPLRPGHWKIDVHLPGYQPQVRELDVPAAHAPGITSVRDVRIDLQRGAVVGGTVRDARGQRIGGAHVTVRRADGTGDPLETDADSQGEFRLRDALTGELVVGATHDGAGGSTAVTVKPGDEILGLSIEIR